VGSWPTKLTLLPPAVRCPVPSAAHSPRACGHRLLRSGSPLHEGRALPWFLKAPPKLCQPPFLALVLRGRQQRRVEAGGAPVAQGGRAEERSAGRRAVGRLAEDRVDADDVVAVAPVVDDLERDDSSRSATFKIAVVGDPGVPAPWSDPVTRRHVTGPDTRSTAGPLWSRNDAVPLGFCPEAPLCALMAMSTNRGKGDPEPAPVTVTVSVGAAGAACAAVAEAASATITTSVDRAIAGRRASVGPCLGPTWLSPANRRARRRPPPAMGGVVAAAHTPTG
jgi:hypothetical protein